MKAIMISIKPKYVAKILNGEKTIEIRKTMPKCDLPIDVYIYCTKDNKQRLYPVSLLDKSNQVFKRAYREDKIDNRTNYLNGKVIAKFTLNKVDNITYINDYFMFTYYSNTPRKACLTEEEMFKYLNHKTGYAIHISDLEIFDKPKELSEFRFVRPTKIKNFYCSGRLTNAPQNFCYVEE